MLREHRLGDAQGALDAVAQAWRQAERTRMIGRPLPHIEASLAERAQRLRRRLHRSAVEFRRKGCSPPPHLSG